MSREKAGVFLQRTACLLASGWGRGDKSYELQRGLSYQDSQRRGRVAGGEKRDRKGGDGDLCGPF